MTQDDGKRQTIAVEPFEPKSPDLDGRDSSMDPESMTLVDVAEAEASRPTLPEETEDGLDEMDEEIRRQAEGPTDDTPGRI